MYLSHTVTAGSRSWEWPEGRVQAWRPWACAAQLRKATLKRTFGAKPRPGLASVVFQICWENSTEGRGSLNSFYWIRGTLLTRAPDSWEINEQADTSLSQPLGSHITLHLERTFWKCNSSSQSCPQPCRVGLGCSPLFLCRRSQSWGRRAETSAGSWEPFHVPPQGWGECGPLPLWPLPGHHRSQRSGKAILALVFC